jgi:Domain of unknown function (DUF222)/HNH endonuclease
MATHAFTDTRGRLRGAADALVNESIDGVTSSELGADIIEIRLAVDRLEAECLRRLHRFHADRGAQSDGGGTTVSWLRRSCGMTAKAAAYRVHLARTLGEMPATLDSARAGRASFTNVAMIGHLAGAVGVEPVKEFEHILLPAAEALDPGRMRRATESTRLSIDPDGVLADANRAHLERWLDCDQTYGGVFMLRGQFDAEGGALLKTAIDALSHGLSSGEQRLPSQRRADALVEMATAQLRCGDHRDVHGQRPHLTLTVSADTLRSRGTGSETGATPHRQTWSADVGAGDVLHRQTWSTDSETGDTLRVVAVPQAAELGGVGPIHPEIARRIACDAVRTVVTVAPTADDSSWITGSPAVPLSVGRATRTIPSSIRTALVLRDGGCRFPGCDRPPAWTDGHHIIHWADGGPTELDNLVSLCRSHHRQVHEEGWRIHIADGSAVVEPPP